MKALRQACKNQFVFPTMFGAQPSNISVNYEIPEDIAEELQDDFWKIFGGVKEWQERTIEF